MIQVDKISANLERGEHGIWFAKKQSPISYPEHGNLQCLQIEAISFWFKHRNKCILEAMRIFPSEGAIFDVGSGNGYVSFALKNAGFDTIVIEPGFQGAMNAYDKGLNPVICSTLEDARFGFKTTSDFRRNQKEHCHNNSLFGSLLNWALDKELRALRNRRTIPVGGSCFLVATSM